MCQFLRVKIPSITCIWSNLLRLRSYLFEIWLPVPRADNALWKLGPRTPKPNLSSISNFATYHWNIIEIENLSLQLYSSKTKLQIEICLKHKLKIDLSKSHNVYIERSKYSQRQFQIMSIISQDESIKEFTLENYFSSTKVTVRLLTRCNVRRRVKIQFTTIIKWISR